MRLQFHVHMYVCRYVYTYIPVHPVCNSSHSCAGSENGGDECDSVGIEEYWMELAEQRRLALAETLVENEEVCLFVCYCCCCQFYIPLLYVVYCTYIYMYLCMYVQ